jgi:hypothetical protein
MTAKEETQMDRSSKEHNKSLRMLIALALLLVGLFGAGSLLAQSGGVELLRAEYGAGDSWVDVTARVRALVRENYLNLRVDNEALGGDPAPGTPKTLRMQVRDEWGRVSMLSYREKDVIGMAIRTGQPSRDALRITRAQYGAGGRFLDVTDRLNSLMQGNQISLRVNNGTMGGDPAHDARKVLTVWYSYYGYDSQVSVNEGDLLNLPGSNFASGGGFGGLQIIRAEYGADNHYANVTARLAARIRGDRLSLHVTNDAMGGDPAEDLRKTLTVWYRYNGRTASATVAEKEDLNLPGDGQYLRGNLWILRAQYGAGHHYFDVTERLNSQVQGDVLSLRVTNDTMGGDPAEGRHKQLSVSYIYNGRESQILVEEKDYLNLPGNLTGEGGASWGRLQILSATYGAGERARDVTDLLSAQVRGDQLQIQVSNATMGGDPAEGQHKRLRVVYSWQGLRYQAIAIEGETLSIP